MLDFCIKNRILAQVEVIDIESVNTAFERILKGDVHYKFVVDLTNLKQNAPESTG